MKNPSEDKNNRESIDFDHCLKQITEIVEQLETAEIPLEKSIEKFEKGMQLISKCQKALDTAELRVKYIMENNNETLQVQNQNEVDE